MKIGAFVGKFLPPHLGHAQAIMQSAAQCDLLYVVLAENPEHCKQKCMDAHLPNLTAEMRLNWLREHFRNQTNIAFLYMNETGIPPFPDGLQAWSERFWQVVPNIVNMKFADETYRELNENYFPTCTFVPFSRTTIPISATLIRNDLEKNFEYLLPCSQPYFKNVLDKRKKQV